MCWAQASAATKTIIAKNAVLLIIFLYIAENKVRRMMMAINQFFLGTTNKGRLLLSP
jgi:hypothetical protein